LASAILLFAEQGFHGTTLEDVAAAARVTRGAVYHHFENKQALFREVLGLADDQTAGLVLSRAAEATTAWDATVAGLGAFLDRCLDPTYQRISFAAGPTGLGFVAWWEHGEQHMAGLLRNSLASLHAEGTI